MNDMEEHTIETEKDVEYISLSDGLQSVATFTLLRLFRSPVSMEPAFSAGLWNAYDRVHNIKSVYSKADDDWVDRPVLPLVTFTAQDSYNGRVHG